MNKSHYRKLEQMYLSAPFNSFFEPAISVNQGVAEISIELKADFHHAAQAVHGSVYFKMLDDAAYFAANSLEDKYFMLTTTFTTYLTRPVSDGIMRAKGQVVSINSSQFIAESVVYNADGKELGRGHGIFVRSKNQLSHVQGYNGVNSAIPKSS
ncbi:MAG: PaaI family thioesterase [Marinicella sp.]